MTNPWIALIATLAILGFSAFFVIIEFGLMGARGHRLEDNARTSRGARAALRGIHELTIMLAGAQLGITAATFALGAITKPAVETALSPVVESIGMPGWLSGTASFVLSLLVVTFLHLVVGEMAPKSWAIANPERAAVVVSLPARGFVQVFRPLLLWNNTLANRLVAASGVEPVDRAAVGGRDAATIGRLVEHSAEVGALEETVRTPISEAIELETLTVEDLLSQDTEPIAVEAEDTVAEIQAAARESSHMRILVNTPNSASPGVVHVRDTLLESTDRPAAELAREAYTVPIGTPVHEALADMRASSEQLAVVMDDTTLLGIITFHDALSQLLPSHEPSAD